MRTLGDRGLMEMAPVYHRLWQDSVKRIFRPAKINHFMIHGNCSDLIALCKKEGRVTIGEAVNAHPVYQDGLLNEEARARGVRHYTNDWITKTMLEEFDAVDYLLVSSQFVKRTFVERGYDERKIITLPYGVDPAPGLASETAVERSREKEPVRILCVGQVCIRKGQYYLLDAIKTLNKSGGRKRFHLTLVGRCDPAYMKCLAALSEDFDHVSHIENSEMIRFMAGFDIFVLPSLEDGFSVVVTEALSAGLPVITTMNNGAADIIEDGDNGVVVPAGNSLALKRAIERVIDEKITGKKKSLSSWKDYAKQLKARCQHLLAEQVHE
jgi:glycosyltransferase involved in cell wall biosynthesis